MSGFVKIDEDILTSSLWVERDLRSVFLTALFMAEPHEILEPEPQYEVRSLEKTGWMVPPGWYGFVRASGTAIVRMDGCEKEVGLRKLEELSAGDPDSRSQGFEGRRMARINGGYLILNYMQYRDRDYTAADRMRRLRERRKGLSPDVTPNSDGVTANVTDAEGRGQRAEELHPPSTREETDGQIDEATLTIHRYAHKFENPESWASLLVGYLDGLGTEGGKKATREQVALACNEADVLGGEMTPRRFRRILGQIMEKPQPPIKTAATGKMLRAGEVIAEIRKCRNPQFPNSALPEWRDKLSQREVRAVNAVGVDRILNDKQEGVVLSQLARTLAEAEA